MAIALKKSEAKKSYTTALLKKKEEKDKKNPFKNQLSGWSEKKTVKTTTNPITQNTTTNSWWALLKPNTQVLKQMQQNPKEASVIADNSFNTWNTNNVQYQINNQKSKFEIWDNPTKRTQTTWWWILSDFVPTVSASNTNNTQDTYSKTPANENIRMYLYEAEKSWDKQKIIEAEEIKKALNNWWDENKINEIIVKELWYTPSDKVKKSYNYSSDKDMKNINSYLNDPNESDIDKEYIKWLLERWDNPSYINQQLKDYWYNYDRVWDVVDTAKNFWAWMVWWVPKVVWNVGWFVADVNPLWIATNNLVRLAWKEWKIGDWLREWWESIWSSIETSLAPDPLSGAVWVWNFATDTLVTLPAWWFAGKWISTLAKWSKALKNPTVQKLANSTIGNIWKWAIQWAWDMAVYDVVSEWEIKPEDLKLWAGIWTVIPWVKGVLKWGKKLITPKPLTKEELTNRILQTKDAEIERKILEETWEKAVDEATINKNFYETIKSMDKHNVKLSKNPEYVEFTNKLQQLQADLKNSQKWLLSDKKTISLKSFNKDIEVDWEKLNYYKKMLEDLEDMYIKNWYKTEDIKRIRALQDWKAKASPEEIAKYIEQYWNEFSNFTKWWKMKEWAWKYRETARKEMKDFIEQQEKWWKLYRQIDRERSSIENTRQRVQKVAEKIAGAESATPRNSSSWFSMALDVIDWVDKIVNFKAKVHQFIKFLWIKVEPTAEFIQKELKTNLKEYREAVKLLEQNPENPWVLKKVKDMTIDLAGKFKRPSQIFIADIFWEDENE